MLYINPRQLVLTKVLMTHKILPSDLLLYDGEQFISAAYEHVLLRPVDASGLKSGLSFLSARGGKLRYIVELSLSTEATQSNPGIVVDGMSALLRRLLRVQLAEGLIERLFYNRALKANLFYRGQNDEVGDFSAVNALFRADRRGCYEAAPFFALHDVHFVQAVYIVLLGFRPSAFAEDYWASQLRDGSSRISVLQAVSAAGPSKASINHMWLLYVSDFLMNLPVIGNLFAALFYLPNMKRIRKYILSIENELYRKKMMLEL